ncbi:hypothetical protein DPMN_157393 [Dreissena polymorpha]|uniref:Uncharacterized protein n=1 Tax=Dreissena polymorpha TaxID=45954 RepID=A0A9D4EH87_DREPO|nr:hypothetical protein DPMN_157393 [Dreissena polymorpha]
MHAKYEVAIFKIAKVIAKCKSWRKQTDQQNNRQGKNNMSPTTIVGDIKKSNRKHTSKIYWSQNTDTDNLSSAHIAPPCMFLMFQLLHLSEKLKKTAQKGYRVAQPEEGLSGKLWLEKGCVRKKDV